MSLFFTMLVPLIMAAVAVYAMARRVDVYDALVQGAGEGLGVLARIVPPLIGLLTAVYMLRASGALELAAQALSPVLSLLGIPPETVGLLLVRPGFVIGRMTEGMAPAPLSSTPGQVAVSLVIPAEKGSNDGRTNAVQCCISSSVCPV